MKKVHAFAAGSIFGNTFAQTIIVGVLALAMISIGAFFMPTPVVHAGGISYTSATTTPNVAAVNDQSATTATPTPNVVAASAVAQVSTVTPTGVVEVGDIFTVTINGLAVPYTAGSGTVADVTAGLTAAINLSAQAANVTAVDTGALVQITSDVPGTSFTITSGAVNGADPSNVDLTQDAIANTTVSNAAAVSAAAQINTITIAGTVEAGDVYTATLPTVGAVNYTVQSGDTTTANIASGLNAAILASAGYAGQDFTTGVVGNVITLTAKVAGTGFTQTSGATNRTAVAQVATFTPDFVVAGWTFRTTINGTQYDYTSTDSSVVTVVAALTTLLDGAPAISCVDSTTFVTCTADAAGTLFTFSTTVLDVTAPVITLTGTTPISIEYGSTYTDAGATALDTVDGTSPLLL